MISWFSKFANFKFNLYRYVMEIMPVLPDFDRWPGSYVHFVYDEVRGCTS